MKRPLTNEEKFLIQKVAVIDGKPQAFLTDGRVTTYDKKKEVWLVEEVRDARK